MKVFKEEQRFNQVWLIILMAVSCLIPLILILKEYIESEKTNKDFYHFLVPLLILIFATSFIFFFKLKTRIDETGIYFRFFPFHFKYKFYPWREIEKSYVRTYDPLSEYGGWGIKGGRFWNKNKGIAYNVSGYIGIQLVLRNGKKVLIGTQKENEAKQVLETYKDKLEQEP